MQYNDGRDLYVKRPDEDARREERELQRKKDREKAGRVIDRLIGMAVKTATAFNDEYSDTVNSMVWDFINNAYYILDGAECHDDPEVEDCEDVQTTRRVIADIIDTMCTVLTNDFSSDNYNAVVDYIVWDFIDSIRSKLAKWVIRVPPPE